jgi:Questin oxidase-like
MDAAARGALTALLDRQIAFHAEYRGGLSNHLPMALVALARMGAEPERLQTYARLYERRLDPAPAEGRVLPAAEWPRHLGRKERYGDFLATFRGAIAEHGWEGALHASLPILMPGCGAAAFHPLIRLAFAIEAQAPGEMAIALSYWASRFLPLPSAPASSLSSDPEELLARLAEDDSFSHRPDPDALIDAELQRAASAPGFAPVIGWLTIDDETPRRLARAALRVYAATMDFTALHMVTGTQAARIVLPCCPDREAALRWFWQALAAAYLSIGKPALTGELPFDGEGASDWPDILAAARVAADEHLIKIVYSSWVEDAAYGDPLYREVVGSVVRNQKSDVS